MRKTITFGAIVALVFLHGTALAQMQDKAQQKCISALNKGMVKVASAQTKARSKEAASTSSDRPSAQDLT